MSNQPDDIKMIDGEAFVSGRLLIRLTIATAIARPTSQQGRLFQNGVMPVIRNGNEELANQVETLIDYLSDFQFQFRIQRGMQEIKGFDPFYLLPKKDHDKIDALCQQIDEEIGLAEIMRAMKFNPVGLDGSPIAS